MQPSLGESGEGGGAGCPGGGVGGDGDDGGDGGVEGGAAGGAGGQPIVLVRRMYWPRSFAMPRLTHSPSATLKYCT